MEKTMNKYGIPTLLTVEQLAQALPYSEHTIRTRCAPKAKNPFPIRVKRIAGRLMFLQTDVVQYVENL
jgi:hypothetical protein